MSCDSWIFIHKHISDAEDGNGRIIERKVLWQYKSWKVGEMFANTFYLNNGSYRSTCPEHLIEFANECIAKLDITDLHDELDAFKEMKVLLENPDVRNNYFVSVDW